MNDQEENKSQNLGNTDQDSNKRSFDELTGELSVLQDAQESNTFVNNEIQKSLTKKHTSSTTESSSPTPSQSGEEDGKPKRDEKKMELNRLRARDIRKRKKKMVEDMQKQIIYLTIENNKLRNQVQIQQSEINLLRQTAHGVGGILNNNAAVQQQQQQQQQFQNYLIQQNNLNSNAIPNEANAASGIPSHLISVGGLNSSLPTTVGLNGNSAEVPIAMLSSSLDGVGSTNPVMQPQLFNPFGMAQNDGS